MPQKKLNRERYRLILLGLDGATFRLLHRLVRKGWMPNLGEALARGAHGPLTSVIPPYSAPAWVSFATGQNPGRHGVPDFWLRDESGGRRPVSSKCVRAPTLWAVLSGYGRRVAVINVPVTYPPQPVNGLLISGMMTPSEDAEYTYPAELKRQLGDPAGAYAANPHANAHRSADFLKRTARWVRQREGVHRRLWEQEKWDCFINVVQAPDPIQHLFWHVLDSNHPNYNERESVKFEPLLEACYRAVDEVIGHRLRQVDERTTLVVVSDHGFEPAYRYFYVNRLLADLGLLVQRETSRGRAAWVSSWQRRGLSMARRAVRRLDRLGWRHRLLDNRRREAIRSALEQAMLPIDWEQTEARFTHLTGEGIIIRGRDDDREQYEATRQRILHALRTLRDPATGDRVVAAAYRREDVLSGPWVDLAPDILFSVGEGPYLPTGKLDYPQPIGPTPDGEATGRHHQDGILIAVGPFIRPGTISGARIVDIMPTALYLQDLPIPEGLDGQVLHALFSDEQFSRQPICFAPPPPWEDSNGDEDYDDEDIARITQHLEDLGYL